MELSLLYYFKTVAEMENITKAAESLYISQPALSKAIAKLEKSLDVTLRGNPESLSQIREENIRAVADLEDMYESTGTYMPKVRIYVDGFTDVGAITAGAVDYTISVEIERVNG